MGTADIIGTTVGKENTCGAVHGRMKSGALTYFRLSTDDLTGEIKAYVGEGQSVDDPRYGRLSGGHSGSPPGKSAVVDLPQRL